MIFKKKCNCNDGIVIMLGSISQKLTDIADKLDNLNNVSEKPKTPLKTTNKGLKHKESIIDIIEHDHNMINKPSPIVDKED